MANNCANFCEEFKLLQEDEIFKLYLAGLLHDFGLIFFSDTILREPEKRTDDKTVQMRKHPIVGEKILSNLSTLKDMLPMIRYHHEAIESEDFLLKKAIASIREIFTKIIQDFIAGKITPPVMPHVVREVQLVIKRINSNADDVAAVIEKDPVISFRLISIANSLVYRGIQEISNVREAIPRMGLKETLNIIITIANKSLYETDQAQFRILMDKLWVHSLASAYGSKLIAERLKLDDSEKFFLMGLVHDIGKSLLLKAFTGISAIKNINFDVIQANIQQGHLSVGGILLRRWGFDDAFIKVVTLHEGHELTTETGKEILVIHLAGMLTRTIGYSLFDNEVDFNELDSAKFLEMDPDTLVGIGEEIKRIIQDVAHLF